MEAGWKLSRPGRGGGCDGCDVEAVVDGHEVDGAVAEREPLGFAELLDGCGPEDPWRRIGGVLAPAKGERDHPPPLLLKRQDHVFVDRLCEQVGMGDRRARPQLTTRVGRGDHSTPEHAVVEQSDPTADVLVARPGNLVQAPAGLEVDDLYDGSGAQCHRAPVQRRGPDRKARSGHCDGPEDRDGIRLRRDTAPRPGPRRELVGQLAIAGHEPGGQLQIGGPLGHRQRLQEPADPLIAAGHIAQRVTPRRASQRGAERCQDGCRIGAQQVVRIAAQGFQPPGPTGVDEQVRTRVATRSIPVPGSVGVGDGHEGSRHDRVVYHGVGVGASQCLHEGPVEQAEPGLADDSRFAHSCF